MDVFIDFKSPAAYLAFKPTLALADRLANAHQVDETINWFPVPTKQGAIPKIQDDEDRGTTHRRVRAIARQNMHLHYAKVLNLPMQFRDTPGNTDLALAALETLSGDKERFIEAAFNAYWTSEADLSDPATVQALLTETECSADLTNPEAALDQAFNRSQTNGAIDAPAYVVRGQLFIGREHLPWIEAIVTDG